MLILLPTPQPQINAGNENGGGQTIITFYNCTQKAIADSPVEAKVTWAHIKTTMAPLLQKVCSCSRAGYPSACSCCCCLLSGCLVMFPLLTFCLERQGFLLLVSSGNINIFGLCPPVFFFFLSFFRAWNPNDARCMHACARSTLYFVWSPG